MVAEEEIVARPTDELRRIGQQRLPARKVRPAPLGERHRFVEKDLGPGDHLGAARRVIAAARRQRPQRVGAVERIIEAPPARIGGVEQEACVQHRHDQLRPGEPRDLVVDAIGGNGEGGGFGNEIADLAQEGLIGSALDRLPGARLMPGVDPGLEVIALREQRGILGREAGEEGGGALPERLRFDAGAGQHLPLDEVRQRCRDAKSRPVDPVRHAASPFTDRTIAHRQLHH